MEGSKLYVGNLKYSVTNDQLKEEIEDLEELNRDLKEQLEENKSRKRRNGWSFLLKRDAKNNPLIL